VPLRHLIPMQRRTLLLVLTTLMASGSADAQAPPSSTTPPPAVTGENVPRDRSAGCAPTQVEPNQRGHANSIAPSERTTGQVNEPLGDKLARSDGILCPPAGVDPGMRAPTPEGGSIQVIPPPGSPGGDPTIRPK
jgi:hypothetical protein